MHLLFVCTGNICRSPTAERLSVAYAARLEIADFTASSAGTRAVVGHAVHRDSEFALRKLGGDPSNFTARQLTSKIASSADLVLTMTRPHRDSVLELAPRQLNRTFTLVEAARLLFSVTRAERHRGAAVEQREHCADARRRGGRGLGQEGNSSILGNTVRNSATNPSL